LTYKVRIWCALCYALFLQDMSVYCAVEGRVAVASPQSAVGGRQLSGVGKESWVKGFECGSQVAVVGWQSAVGRAVVW